MARQSVLVLGAGKIGSLITCLLSQSGEYHVHLGNSNLEAARTLVAELKLPGVSLSQVDAQNGDELEALFAQHRFDAVISALPYYCNTLVAEVAASYRVSYFDITEDVAVTEQVKKISREQQGVFMPQCGLAPGFISIVANDLIRHFKKVDTVKMRVGALPVNQNNALKYSLTWSTDGLINEYSNPCHGIEGGRPADLLPLEGLESIILDGVNYEAFNTSGGVGTLVDSYAGRVERMNYKTVRYPGHCQIIKLLMHDLKLKEDRAILKRILEHAVPQTLQDVVLIYVSVTGFNDGELYEESYVKKLYPTTIAGRLWSSIQVTTAAAVCAVVDIVLHHRDRYQGFVCQEDISLEEFLANRFGKYYA